ncbi:type II toxin-antitoxin system HicA family toxin [Pseudomonas sp. F1_0610]|uniref:type II toxin-antitoxin system HicA family toxin n=1 Tax=Pseudomonas sp. F1_0610 TaxID=3114284 RepID=UPI0039C48513
MQSRELIKELEEAGWELQRINGSHHIFRHPEKKLSIPVPHPKKDLPIGTVKAIKKQAGLL